MENRIKKRLFVLLLAAWLSAFMSGCGLLERLESIKTEISQEEGKSEPTSGTARKQKKRVKKKKDSDGPEDRTPVQTEDASEDMEEAPEETQRAQEDANAGELYTGYFAYQTLDDETKQVYHEVLTAILEHGEKAELSTLDVDVLEKAYKAVCADNGGLFWVSGYVYTQYTRGGDLIGMDFTPKYTMAYEEREQYQQQIDASVEELLAGISIVDSDYAKAKYVFEILVQNVDYDAASENNQNIISTFLNRSTVCQGYACGTQYLLHLLGIQSVIVTGNAGGESHAWNLVCLDGNYYHMDTTWGNSRYLDRTSQIEKYVNYNYLAVTSEEIARTHRTDESFPLPECTSIEDNYFVRENRYFAEWNPDVVGAVLAEAWNAGANSAAVKLATAEIYEQVKAYFIEEQHIADYCEGISSIYYLEDPEMGVVTFHF